MNTSKVLFLCTGNSCRSQMAEGILKSLNKDIDVYSAGTRPSERVHPNAVADRRFRIEKKEGGAFRWPGMFMKGCCEDLIKAFETRWRTRICEGGVPLEVR